MKLPSARMNKERQTALTRLQDVRNELAGANKELAEKQKALDALKEKIQTAGSDYDALILSKKEQVRELDNSLKEIAQTHSKLVIQKKCLQDDVSDIESDAAIAYDALEKIKGETVSVSAEIAERNNDLSRIHINLDKAKSDIDTELQTLSKVKNDIVKANKVLHGIHDDIAVSRKTLRSIEAKKAHMQQWEKSLSERESLVRKQYDILGIRKTNTYGN